MHGLSQSWIESQLAHFQALFSGMHGSCLFLVQCLLASSKTPFIYIIEIFR